MSVSIIPAPKSLELGTGNFIWRNRTAIHCDSPLAVNAAERFRQWSGSMSHFGDSTGGSSSMRWKADPSIQNPEGYRLTVAATSVDIEASHERGFLRAFQTLRQIFPKSFVSSGSRPSEALLPILKIEDEPRFRWRGLLLDSARHYQPISQIFKLLDLLALYKINVLHWHFIDDQGWRVEIDKYPRLTTIGGWREDSKGNRYGGYYSKSEMRRVVEYATGLGIDILPEVELPGHSSAAIAAYPDLSCTDDEKKVPTTWGVFPDITCAGKDSTIDFYRNVLDEVVEIFPFPYLHIGGDEAPKEAWKSCPLCQKRIQKEGLKDEDQLQTWMTMQIQQHLEKKGRRIIGWDELEEGGMPPGAILQHWRWAERMEGALRSGHEVIMSRNVYTYFNYHYDKDPTLYNKNTQRNDWMPAIGTAKAYAYDPLADDSAKENAANVIGGECCLWTEFIDSDNVEWHLFPRILAFAERFWSPETRNDYEEFAQRLEPHKGRLKALGVHVYEGPEAGADWKQIYPPGLEPNSPVA